jgi:hypothetical protein
VHREDVARDLHIALLVPNVAHDEDQVKTRQNRGQEVNVLRGGPDSGIRVNSNVDVDLISNDRGGKTMKAAPSASEKRCIQCQRR